VAAAKKALGGSCSYRSFPSCLEVQLYIPGCKEDGSVEMAETPIDGWEYTPTTKALKRLKEEAKLVESGEMKGDLSLTTLLLGQMQMCDKHKLLFTIGY